MGKDIGYIVGHRETYRKDMAEAKKGGVELQKFGGSLGYYGCRVFTTACMAWTFIKTGGIVNDLYALGIDVDRKDFSVFSIILDFDKDTYFHQDFKMQCLLNTCPFGGEHVSGVTTILDDSSEFLSMCEEGCLTYVEDLIDSGVNPKIRNSYALQTAAKHGHLEVVKYLVEEHGLDINENLPAKEALWLGHYHVAKYLIGMGASIGKKNISLFSSCGEGMIECLLESGLIDDEILEEINRFKKSRDRVIKIEQKNGGYIISTSNTENVMFVGEGGSYLVSTGWKLVEDVVVGEALWDYYKGKEPEYEEFE